jgi:hypothetical protein
MYQERRFVGAQRADLEGHDATHQRLAESEGRDLLAVGELMKPGLHAPRVAAELRLELAAVPVVVAVRQQDVPWLRGETVESFFRH